MCELLSFILVAAVAFGVGLLLTARPPLDRFRPVVLLAVLFRLLGATLRVEVLSRLYDDVGDADAYFEYGKTYAGYIHRLDFSFLTSDAWSQGNWWGTQFVRYVSAFVIALVGPSRRGGFLAFSILSFVGLALIGQAFLRTLPPRRHPIVLYWLFFSPSLWFWPSSMGKEALIVFAAGLFFAGYVGDGRRTNWPLLAAGTLGAFAVRPHVAAVMLTAVALAAWLERQRHWMPGDYARRVILAGAAVAVMIFSLRAFGLESPDLEGVSDYQQFRASQTMKGGSQVASSGGNLAALPLAYVDVLFRPSPWEANNPQALLSALEILVFWTLILGRHRRIRRALSLWRTHKILRFSALFVLLYTPLIGVTFFNLGIIARQRVLVWPFLFCLVEGLVLLSYPRAAPRAAPARVMVGAAAGRRRRVA